MTNLEIANLEKGEYRLPFTTKSGIIVLASIKNGKIVGFKARDPKTNKRVKVRKLKTASGCNPVWCYTFAPPHCTVIDGMCFCSCGSFVCQYCQ